MNRSKIAIAIIIIVTILSLTVSGYIILLLGQNDSFSDKCGIWLSVFSIVISVIALVYAMRTYYSIDRVQSINSMEGNVLCNKNYSVAYPENIQYFEDCFTDKEFQEKLFNLLLYKKSANCKEYTEHIQCVVDNLTWVAWAKHDKIFYEKCNHLIAKLNSDKRKFRYINSGLSTLFDENIKLISYVINYQNHRIANSDEISRVENIRGKSLETPIAQITFFNYLGLEYMKRARDLLGVKNVYSRKGMSTVVEKNQKGNYLPINSYYSALLEVSENSFMKASQIADDDLIWNGYISYNLARVKVMQYLLNNNKFNKCEIEKYIETVLNKRENILHIIWADNEQSSDEYSYLHQKFIKEVNAVRKLLNSFRKI